MDKYKSPIKAKALRNPGQSLEEKIDVLINDKLIFYFLVSALFSIYAMLEWFYWYFKTPRNPWLFTAVAVVSIFVSVYQFRRIRKSVRKYRQGLDGERTVGQFLDKLRSNGYEVFHDIVFDGFNVDHVVITTKGIYSIETKTYSKPEKGEAKIPYDGEAVVVNGYRSKAPIIQAKASAKTIQELIENSTGKKIPVKPVLLLPGWFVETTTTHAQNEVWALNPKALDTFIQNNKESISEEDVNLIAYHISRYVRSL